MEKNASQKLKSQHYRIRKHGFQNIADYISNRKRLKIHALKKTKETT